MHTNIGLNTKINFNVLNVASRKCKIIHMAHICELLSIFIGLHWSREPHSPTPIQLILTMTLNIITFNLLELQFHITKSMVVRIKVIKNC